MGGTPVHAASRVCLPAVVIGVAEQGPEPDAERRRRNAELLQHHQRGAAPRASEAPNGDTRRADEDHVRFRSHVEHRLPDLAGAQSLASSKARRFL
jgi:hypothetical protein